MRAELQWGVTLVTDNRIYWNYVLATASVFAIGVAMRLLPLYWTPFPFNPDGFVFAAIARDSLAAGYVPSPAEHRSMASHRYVFVVILTVLGRITGLEPLWIAQATIAIIGTVPALFAMIIVRKLGVHIGWSTRRILIAATLAGFLIATEGLYLRRSVAVSYEVLGLLLLPAVALCVHRYFESSNRAWLGAAGLMLLVFPATHHISTMIAAITLTILIAIWLTQQQAGWTLFAGSGILLGFWTYLLLYYAQSPPDGNRVFTANPALFVAWIVLIIFVAHWFRISKPKWSRGSVACIGVLGFGVLALNAIQPVFPGTSSTPPLLLALVAPLMVFGVLTVWGLPVVIRLQEGWLVLALLAAPLAFVGLGLTSGLSPQYDILVRRSQTFVHLGVIIITVIAAFELCDCVYGRSQPLGRVLKVGLPIALILVAVVTIPIAFIGLEALSYQGTTTEAEFSTATFASATLPDPWTGDDHITRIERNYYGSAHNSGSEPVYNWLHGGDPPACPTVADHSWTTVGAQLYPAPPEQLSENTYMNWKENNNVIYTSGSSTDQAMIVSPPGESATSC